MYYRREQGQGQKQGQGGIGRLKETTALKLPSVWLGLDMTKQHTIQVRYFAAQQVLFISWYKLLYEFSIFAHWRFISCTSF